MLGFGNHTSIPRLSLSWLAFATSDDKKKERDISGLNKNTSILTSNKNNFTTNSNFSLKGLFLYPCQIFQHLDKNEWFKDKRTKKQLNEIKKLEEHI